MNEQIYGYISSIVTNVNNLNIILPTNHNILYF